MVLPAATPHPATRLARLNSGQVLDLHFGSLQIVVRVHREYVDVIRLDVLSDSDAALHNPGHNDRDPVDPINIAVALSFLGLLADGQPNSRGENVSENARVEGERQ